MGREEVEGTEERMHVCMCVCDVWAHVCVCMCDVCVHV